jgi:hypothetical protein
MFTPAASRGVSETRLMRLDHADFRVLIDGILSVDRLNAKVRRGYVLDREFHDVLGSLEPLTGKLPDYYELQYFVGSVAESAGNKTKAARWYRAVVAAPEGMVSSAIVGDARERLARVETVVPTEGTEAEQAFRAEATRFAELMGLEGADPKIVFKPQKESGLQALWNGDEHQYEVNPDHVKTPGMPQYVALMGRFMEQHYERCFGEGKPGGDANFWNEFRISTVDYLIRSVPEFSQVDTYGSRYPWFKTLKNIESQTGQPPQRLALELLNRYDCNWSTANFEGHVQTVAKERGLVAPEIITKAFQAARTGKAPAGR